MGFAFQESHLVIEQINFASVPAITEYHNNIFGRKLPCAEGFIKQLQAMADACSPAPVRNRSRNLRNGGRKITSLELMGYSGKIGWKQKNFGSSINPFQGMDELQDHEGINIHGTADIAKKDNPAFF